MWSKCKGNKAIEIETYPDTELDFLSFNFDILTDIRWFHLKLNVLWFAFNIDWTRKTDHAGIRLKVKMLNKVFSIYYYDIRHWDYEKNTWCVYP